jgi:hypothetical protein
MIVRHVCDPSGKIHIIDVSNVIYEGSFNGQTYFIYAHLPDPRDTARRNVFDPNPHYFAEAPSEKEIIEACDRLATRIALDVFFDKTRQATQKL